jgi:hypothetical protein
MSKHHEETLLILTKTYPSPSTKYRETSCVAAINDQGELRRLYPIPFRLLDDSRQFARWEWVKTRILKATNDNRPESYRVDTDSIQRLARLGTDQGWAERLQWITPHILPDFETLESRRQTSNETLGFLRPSSVELIITRANSKDWTDDEKQKLIQDGMFDSPDVKARIPLRKLPYDFYYRYKFNGLEKQFKHKITDWEIGALYWNCAQDYQQNWEKYFRQKIEEDFSQKRELIFMMGTIHRFPDQWLIVGVLYPPKVEARQQALFLAPPGD